MKQQFNKLFSPFTKLSQLRAAIRALFQSHATGGCRGDASQRVWEQACHPLLEADHSAATRYETRPKDTQADSRLERDGEHKPDLCYFPMCGNDEESCVYLRFLSSTTFLIIILTLTLTLTQISSCFRHDDE